MCIRYCVVSAYSGATQMLVSGLGRGVLGHVPRFSYRFLMDSVCFWSFSMTRGLHYSLSGQTLPKEEQKQWRSAKFETMCSDKVLDGQSLSSSSLAKIYPAERVRFRRLSSGFSRFRPLRGRFRSIYDDL